LVVASKRFASFVRQTSVHDSLDKRLNEMNRLRDMGHFPASVNLGATINVLLTVLLTWFVEPRFPALAGVWVGIVLLVNVIPVVLLRLTMRDDAAIHTLREMKFLTDQHKFSDWVYVAASANMTFWILLTWTISAVARTSSALLAVEIVAFLATFSPVLLRRTRR
jgi:hypothetical protein